MSEYERPGAIPEPSEEEIDAAMQSTAASLGTRFESRDELVSRLNKEGWELITVIKDAYDVSAPKDQRKEIKIVERGKESLVFERSRDNVHE